MSATVLTKTRRRAALGAVCAAAVALPLLGAATAQAGTSAPLAPLARGWTTLKLLHQWHDDSITGKPAVKNISGIVHFRGEMLTPGTNKVAFILPAADRPATAVTVQIDLGYATAGTLNILPSGVTRVASEQAWSN